MTMMQHPETNTASTQDWLRASQNMTISAYDPNGSTIRDTQATDHLTRHEEVTVGLGGEIRQTK